MGDMLPATVEVEPLLPRAVQTPPACNIDATLQSLAGQHPVSLSFSVSSRFPSFLPSLSSSLTATYFPSLINGSQI